MKVYVITDGNYSDYHIKQVFLNKDKAESFAKLHQYRVEEYDIFDDNYIIPDTIYYQAHISFKMIRDIYNKYSVQAKSQVIITETADKPADTKVLLNSSPYGKDEEFYINIYVYRNKLTVSEQELTNRTISIGYETCALIQHLLSENSYDTTTDSGLKKLETDINTML